MDLGLNARFGSTASNWADNLMEEIGDKHEQSIRDFAEKQLLPRIIWEVCRACENEGIRSPEKQEAYAKRAVAQFDRRLNHLLAKRQGSLH
jgi:hypothetical protein